MPLREQFLKLYQNSGMSYADLAKASGVSTATISRIVNGGSANTENLEALIAALEDGADDAPRLPNIMTAHCDRCRADQNEHNRLLREDFNIRHEELRKDYEARIDELKQLYAQRHEMHEAEKKRLQFRLRWVSFAFLALVIFVCVILTIDVMHGGVGWFRYWAEAGYHSIWEEVVRYVADAINLL